MHVHPFFRDKDLLLRVSERERDRQTDRQRERERES